MPGDQMPPSDPAKPGVIHHTASGLRPATPPAPPAAAPSGEAAAAAASKIRSFAQGLGAGRHEDSWNRSPNATGTGAIHVKSFHCKLTGDSLEFLDQQINE